MKILMITKYFYPEKAIAAVRPTKFAKYLHDIYHCDIDLLYLGKADPNVTDSPYLNQIFRMQEQRCFTRKLIQGFLKKRSKSNNRDSENNRTHCNQKVEIESSSKKSFIKKVFYCLNFHAYIADGKATLKYFRRTLLKKIDFSGYDVIWSTFGPIGTHLIARSITKKNKVKWVADFRDAVCSPDTPKLYYGFCKRYVHNIERYADAVTFVSKGCGEDLQFKNGKAKKCLLYNGFDRDDFDGISTNKYDKFTIAYTGQFYAGRNMSPLLLLLLELFSSGNMDRNDVCILYAGPNGQHYKKMCEAYGMSDIYADIGYVNREESLKVQKNSHCLLLLSWNRKNSKGIISGKFYEYVCSGTPIIGIITGDRADSELKQMIDEFHLGACYEEANSEQDKEVLKEFLLQCYSEYKSGYSNKNILNETVNVFDYKVLTCQLYDIFNRIKRDQ